MLQLAMLAALAAQPPVKVAVPTFAGIDLDPKVVAFLSEHFAQQLAAQGLQALTPEEMRALLGHEREKLLLGCGDLNCMVELAGALGVDGVVTGSIAKIGNSVQIDIKVLAAADARTLSASSDRAASEDDLVAALDRLAPPTAREVMSRLGRAGVAAPPPSHRGWAWLPAMAGGALVVGGSVSIALASDRYGQITRHPPLLAQAQTSASQGETFQTLAYVGWGAGAACVATAALVWLSGGPSLRATLAPVPEGGLAVSVGGTFP